MDDRAFKTSLVRDGITFQNQPIIESFSTSKR